MSRRLALSGPLLRQLAAAPLLRASTLGAPAPYRSDAEIVAMIEAAASEYGKPRCLFLSGLLPYANPGLETNDPVYQQATFPNDTPAYQQAASRTSSSCGLWTENAWRYAGVDDPDLWVPYADRVAKGGIHFTVARQKYFATQVGAWQDAIHWEEGTPYPEPGDSIIIGCASCPGFARGTANLEHEMTLGAWDTGPSGPIFHSLDGGQPGFHVRTRALVPVAGELWAAAVSSDGSVPLSYDGRPVTGRRVLGWTRVDKLPLVPNGNECITSTGASLPGVDGGGLLLPLAGGAVVAALLAFTPWGRALLARLGLR